MTDPQTPATEARWGDGDVGEDAVLADWDAEQRDLTTCATTGTLVAYIAHEDKDMTLPTQYSEPWAAGPDDPFAIESCPECGAEDAEYGLHEPECPSGYPVRDDPERKALQDATREYEDEA